MVEQLPSVGVWAQAQQAGSGAAAPASAAAQYAFAPAPLDPTAAPEKVAVMNADGTYSNSALPSQAAAASPSAAYNACAHKAS